MKANGILTNHPASELFPLMEGEEFESFKADIEKNGQCEPIYLLDEQILDGRNRYRACCELGIEPDFKQWPHGEGTPEDFVLSANLHRRHLSESQRAMIAAKLAKRKRGGDQSKLPIGSLDREQAAEKLNVAERSVNRAAAVLSNGVHGLKEMVESGDVSVSAASTVSTLPIPEQKKIVEKGPAAVKDAANTIRKEAFVFPKGSKSPREEARDDPGVKWANATYKLQIQVGSVHNLGGMEELSKDWGQQEIANELESLTHIRDAINSWIEVLEGKVSRNGRSKK